MFSGLVVGVGTVRAARRAAGGARLAVACALPGEPLARGESVAVAGACLTVAAPAADGFEADVSPETLARTTLGALRAGSRVNLERSLRLSDRIGGHLVLGHVDGTAPVVSLTPGRAFATLRVALPPALAPEVAEKGSLAVDGVSLTVARLGDGWFEAALIPATLADTTLGAVRAGDLVNLETDVIAKYVRRTLSGGRRDVSSLLAEFGDAAD